jgi:hypothetical protein
VFLVLCTCSIVSMLAHINVFLYGHCLCLSCVRWSSTLFVRYGFIFLLSFLGYPSAMCRFNLYVILLPLLWLTPLYFPSAQMPINQLSELTQGHQEWTIYVYVSRLWQQRGGTDEGPIKHTDTVFVFQDTKILTEAHCSCSTGLLVLLLITYLLLSSCFLGK